MISKEVEEEEEEEDDEEEDKACELTDRPLIKVNSRLTPKSQKDMWALSIVVSLLA